MKMKPYLRPRVNGVNKLWMFTKGFGSYLSDMGEHSLRMEEFPGTEDYRGAETFIRRQIDSGYPVPYFMLRHMRREETACGLPSPHTEKHPYFD